MLPSYVLALREGLEAALIIGIVLGALRRLNRTDLNLSVWSGTAAAFLVSLLVALTLNLVGAEFEGKGEEIFEGLSMLFAAGLLTWMIFWMARRSRTLRQEIESDVQQAALQPGKVALFMLAFVAVVREGIELALFLLAARIATDPFTTLVGAGLGILTAMVLGFSLFTTAHRLNLRRFFQMTNIILVLFAAGLVAHGAHELVEAGWIPPLIENVWNLNPILEESSVLGQLLQALFGYNGNPDLVEILAYIGYFVAVFLGMQSKLNTPRPHQSTAA